MEDNELYRYIWKGVFTVVFLLIIWGTIYSVADRLGPVRPREHISYSWPDGTPSK